MNYKLLCHTCNKKLKDYRPIRYGLGKCDKCGVTTGVAEVRYHPQVVEDIFGMINKKANY